MTHPFELSQEIELAATPEQVWDAIATGPGIDSWFMGRTELGTSAGGPANLAMMGHTQQATITAVRAGHPPRDPQRAGPRRPVHGVRVPHRGARAAARPCCGSCRAACSATTGRPSSRR